MDKFIADKEKYKFSPKDRVAHIGNLQQELFVKDIIRRTIYLSEYEKDELTGELRKKKINKIDGILVYWFEENGTAKPVYREQKIHSELLVPFNIAQKGREEAEKWIKEKKQINK